MEPVYQKPSITEYQAWADETKAALEALGWTPWEYELDEDVIWRLQPSNDGDAPYVDATWIDDEVWFELNAYDGRRQAGVVSQDGDAIVWFATRYNAERWKVEA